MVWCVTVHSSAEHRRVCWDNGWELLLLSVRTAAGRQGPLPCRPSRGSYKKIEVFNRRFSKCDRYVRTATHKSPHASGRESRLRKPCRSSQRAKRSNRRFFWELFFAPFVSKKSGVSVCALQNRCSKATQTVSTLFLFVSPVSKRKTIPHRLRRSSLYTREPNNTPC